MSIVNYGFLPGLTTATGTGEPKKEITEEDVKEVINPTEELLDPDDLIFDENTYQLGAVFGTKQGLKKEIVDKAGEYPDYVEEAEIEKPHITLDAEKGVLHLSTLKQFHTYAKEAYMNDDEYQENIKKDPYGDNRDNSFILEANGAQARIYEYDNNVIIAFRGTEFGTNIPEFFSDALDDLNVKVRSIKEMWKYHYELYNGKSIEEVGLDKQGIIHQGFSRYVDRLFDDIISYIFNKGNKNIYLCGHSLGSITAQICAYKLKYVFNYTVAGIYSFGAPRGIYTFEDQFDDLNLYNIIHEHDIITYGLPIFYHYGNIIVLFEDGSYELYQNQEVPYLADLYDEGATISYALRKNGKLSGVGELVKDTLYDNFIHSLGKGAVEGLESFRSLVSMMFQALGNKFTKKFFFDLSTYGITPHQQYKEHLDKLVADIIIPQYDPTMPHHFNDIEKEHKERFVFQSSHKNHHIYKDTKKDELVLIKENRKHYKVIPLTNTKPVGLHFYEKDSDIKNKIVMFYN